MNVKRKCPICNGNVAEKIYTLHYNMPEEYNSSNVIDIVCCRICGMVYDDISSKLNDYEQQSKNNNRYENNTLSSVINYLAEIGDIISSRYHKEKAILDIGCSTGELLDILRDNGFKNICGLDPSKISCEKVSERGINIKNGSIYDQISEFDHKFDVIILSQVLEHLFDISVAIDQIKKWLKNEGQIYITVPDAIGYKDYYGNISSILCAEHINHFSEISLNNIMEKHGFVRGFLLERLYDASDNKDGSTENIASTIDVIYYFSSQKNNNYNIKKDIESSNSVKCLVKEYEEKNATKKEKIKDIIKNKESLILWGASHMAMNLIDTTLKGCNIEAFVDIDHSKQGLTINGIIVKSPDVLYQFDGSILVLENISTFNILENIKQMGLTNKIVIL